MDDNQKPTFRFPDDDDYFMTWKEFVESCYAGHFVDSDGYGELATIDHQVSDVRIDPSDARDGFLKPEWCTHVCWYNR